MRKERYHLEGSSSALVSTIFAVLIMVLVYSYTGINGDSFLDSGRRDKAFADTAALGGLIAQYKLEIGKYPESLTKLTDTSGQYGPWIKEIPQDPYNKGYNYQYKTDSNGFVVFSVGKNKSANSSVSAGISGDDIGFKGK